MGSILHSPFPIIQFSILYSPIPTIPFSILHSQPFHSPFSILQSQPFHSPFSIPNHSILHSPIPTIPFSILHSESNCCLSFNLSFNRRIRGGFNAGRPLYLTIGYCSPDHVTFGEQTRFTNAKSM